MALTYSQTLSYLFNQLPMFTRIGAAAFKKDLTNTLALCELLGNPQHTFKSVHIAGTNGKGSTSHMLASVLQEAGYKVGLYTSPHLRDFRERIRINGEMIPESDVIRFVELYQPDFEKIAPSFFEWTVALCFDYFAREKVDIAIIETGLGGRLDSTNVITPLLSIITNIGWDHMDMLGNTLTAIAGEKAGIIKRQIPVVIGEYDNETKKVFETKSMQEQSQIVYASDIYSLKNIETELQFLRADVLKQNQLIYPLIETDLAGWYQQKNILTVLATIEQLQLQSFDISETAIRNGLANVKRNTSLAGRWQVLSQNPLVICDTGHNINGLEYTLSQLKSLTFSTLHIVIGMVKDKDIRKVLAMLPSDATYYFCQAQIPRALDAVELKEQAFAFGLNGNSYSTVTEALQIAKANASEKDVIFIGGSTFIVAEIV